MHVIGLIMCIFSVLSDSSISLILQFKETLMSNSAVVESVAQALRSAELSQTAITQFARNLAVKVLT